VECGVVWDGRFCFIIVLVGVVWWCSPGGDLESKGVASVLTKNGMLGDIGQWWKALANGGRGDC